MALKKKKESLEEIVDKVVDKAVEATKKQPTELLEQETEQPTTEEPEPAELPKKQKSPARTAKKKMVAAAEKPKPVAFRENRYFVLDTNVLLHDSNSLFAFQGVVVGIPFVVLEELDTFKSETGGRGRNAREVIRQLDFLRGKGSLSKGVRLQEVGIDAFIKVLYLPPEEQHHEFAKTADNQIIATLQYLTKQGMDVTFVTKDINARVKADALSISAEDYTKGTISLDTFYKGWIRVAVPAADVKNTSAGKVAALVDVAELSPNEFVVLESENNPLNTRLFRYLGGQNFKQVGQQETLGSFRAKNTEQLMALDLLLDDSLQIVSLMGPAGTGKTFLALLAGLHKVVNEHLYRKFLISRPIVALGADVGYLPGELKEKLHHWMMPIYDNLEYIFSELPRDTYEETKGKKRGKHGAKDGEFGDTAKDRRQRRRHPDSHRGQSKIDLLERKGILSMEAITYMRGRSIPNQFMFIDEVQNLTPHEVKTLVSRAGEGTKVILAGDPHQIDSPFLDFTSNGLTVTSNKLRGQAIFGTVYLEISERSELAQIAADEL